MRVKTTLYLSCASLFVTCTKSYDIISIYMYTYMMIFRYLILNVRVLWLKGRALLGFVSLLEGGMFRKQENVESKSTTPTTSRQNVEEG